MDVRMTGVAVMVALTPVMGCLGGKGAGDAALAEDDRTRPDVFVVIPETHTGVDPHGFDDSGALRDEPGAQDRFETTPEVNDTVETEEMEVGDDRQEQDVEGVLDFGPYDNGWTCEVDGTPCDDGDLCTSNDRCSGGMCVGTPVDCLDDGIPCTLDLCENGVCVHPVKPATCLIAQRCYNDGDVSLTNSCQYCNAALNPLHWTPATGWLCSDGDPCTEEDQCRDGVCVSGVNQCFPPECTYHSDCYPERVCGVWIKDGKAHCSVPCTGPTDCKTGEVCTHLPGSAGVGYCQVSPLPLGGEFGETCVVNGDCFSFLCVLGVCGHFCADQWACPSGGTCFAAGDGTFLVLGACAPNLVNPKGLPYDWPCTKDAGKTYDSSLCLSGHCDLMTVQPRCARLCSTDSQCGIGQECNLVLYSTSPVAQSVPFHPNFKEKTHDGVLGCFTVATGGWKSVGQQCGSASECRTNKCFALVPQDPTKYCTTFCGSDSDCPVGWQCKPELVNLTNTWLQQDFSQPPKPGSYTLMRMCKPK